ncbi:MAG: FAD-dependent pyridine nucleotide-disulfide oxidoreductase [Deltaproteobacteria bacterium]|nr:FAD-dependent pyridine nucleotide-disulfide oxidoreductase [Deltaproteobacteria bacterium]MBP2684039.1 FAD-dependent pyridine nucleotide-disulfide oxidoreductase [Deltaproteobacteria bacterium]MBP2685271.1 FAD-dependent pyridine nucleotide-disulfide oxidoreductase [Deltaproteobacteria bacterium]MBP2688393.1 FAD-dependent pyridine nucleotide-disulfide oxidoreductase [Deltaproteobacteria bacterium]MBS1243935.1 FAD-dependent pyridine nucleotide-disulfide oxidoreductase [Deltaproteobacteria bact
MRYLILGCGPAGIAAAKAIRGKDKKCEIVIATDEQPPPYLRPLLTDLIMGRVDVAGIADPQAKDLADQGIGVRNGKRALKVDPAGNRVIFADGAEEAYDVLLVATGGKPEIPAPLRKEHPAILPFDSLEDTLRIADRVPRSGTVVVYGPGFLAIVASSALRKRGNDVVWFQPDTPRTGYPISGELEANILDSVRNTGVRILDGQDIAAVREAGGEIEIESTEKGGKIRCLAVVVATERLPAIGFLSGSGLKIGTGIIVDDYLRTSVPNIYAAGDCAELFDKETRTARINFGWRSAIKQGRLAGENMAGAGKRYVREESDYLWVLFGPALLDRIR